MKEVAKEVGLQILAEVLHVVGNHMIKVSNDLKAKQVTPKKISGGIICPGEAAGVADWNTPVNPNIKPV